MNKIMTNDRSTQSDISSQTWPVSSKVTEESVTISVINQRDKEISRFYL